MLVLEHEVCRRIRLGVAIPLLGHRGDDVLVRADRRTRQVLAAEAAVRGVLRLEVHDDRIPEGRRIRRGHVGAAEAEHALAIVITLHVAANTATGRREEGVQQVSGLLGSVGFARECITQRRILGDHVVQGIEAVQADARGGREPLRAAVDATRGDGERCMRKRLVDRRVHLAGRRRIHRAERGALHRLGGVCNRHDRAQDRVVQPVSDAAFGPVEDAQRVVATHRHGLVAPVAVVGLGLDAVVDLPVVVAGVVIVQRLVELGRHHVERGVRIADDIRLELADVAVDHSGIADLDRAAQREFGHALVLVFLDRAIDHEVTAIVQRIGDVEGPEENGLAPGDLLVAQADVVVVFLVVDDRGWQVDHVIAAGDLEGVEILAVAALGLEQVGLAGIGIAVAATSPDAALHVRHVVRVEQVVHLGVEHRTGANVHAQVLEKPGVHLTRETQGVVVVFGVVLRNDVRTPDGVVGERNRELPVSRRSAGVEQADERG